MPSLKMEILEFVSGNFASVDHIYWMEDELKTTDLVGRIFTKKTKLRFIFLIPEGSSNYKVQKLSAYRGLEEKPRHF